MAALKSFNYHVVRNYLNTVEQPDFKMKFDNIALLKKLDVGTWVIDKVWELHP